MCTVAAVVTLQRATAHPSALPLAVDAVPAVAVDGAPSGVPLTDVARLDAEIALFTSARQQDPSSAYFSTQLSARYMQRGRMSGSYADFARAEAEARKALAERTQHNGAAFSILISALLAQHRFEEAARIARQLVAGDPDVPSYRAALGEVELELGHYAAASIAFDSIATERRSLSIAPRLARWTELRGDTAGARASLHRAADVAHADGGLSNADLAWFDLRVGDFELRHGNLAAAETALERGLTIAPDDYRILSALARLHAVQQNWQRAVDFGERAIAVSLDPATLGLLSESYAAQGDTARSAEYLRTMEVAVRAQPGAFHRAWSMVLLDHRRRVQEVYANVLEENRTRHDLYGHDLLAWALYQRGQFADARAQSVKARALGTQDALLYYHAGMIELALADRASAIDLLQRAMRINPYFDVAHPGQVRRTLDSLAVTEPAR